jgi:hypothetical protein
MKTLTLVCNFVLLGLVGLEILTGDFPKESDSLNLVLTIACTILNIVIISGSAIGEIKIPESHQYRLSNFLFLKISAIALNLILLVILSVDFHGGSGILFQYLAGFVILTLLISVVRIAISKWNRFIGFKRTIFLTGIILVLLFTGSFSTIRILIGKGIKENIAIAKKEFPGKAEDALLAYLADSTKSPRDRTKISVWTLGQIRSRKALPVLKSLYNNDPEGKTCKHDSALCQYEIHKAIVSIERNWMGAKEKNVFGSWPRLNK